MKPLFVTFTACAIGACAGSAAMAAAPSSHPAAAMAGLQRSGQASITLVQARTIALKARPGTIMAQELEKEGGGSGLRYAFDVRSGGKTFEVGVDAKTGRVLENGAETAAQEAAETKARRH